LEDLEMVLSHLQRLLCHTMRLSAIHAGTTPIAPRRRKRHVSSLRRFQPRLEGLEHRIVPIAPTVLDPNLGLRTVVQLGATGAPINPTNMVFLGDNDFLLTEKTTGKIDHVINGVVAPTHFDLGAGPINNLPINFNSERGLLGITLSPDFANDHLVYLYWTENNSGPAPDGNVANTPVLGNRVDRFTWNSNTSTLTFDKNIIHLHSFQNDGNGGNPNQMAGNHNAGVIHFGPDGKLYIVIGDNGRRGWMQNLIDGALGPGQTDENNGPVRGGPAPDDAHLTGVMLRLNPDGSIPADNPFADIRNTLQAPLLTGANEVPPSLSIGKGSFTAFLNQAQDTLTVIVSFQGLSGATLPGGADISIGGPSDTGPALFTISNFPGGLSSGQFTATLTAADFTPDPADGIPTLQDAVNAMLSGRTYFNIHTAQNPDGDIRGQIGLISTPMGSESDITTNLHKIYAYGVRNTFGFDFDPVTGKLWMEENGDISFDKISILSPGSNDGWIQTDGPLVNVDGSLDGAALSEFKSIELTAGNGAPQQTRWPSTRIADTPELAMSRLVMLPGASYNAPVYSVRAEDPPAGLGFLTSSALGAGYQNMLFEGEARDFLTDPREEFDGALFAFHPNSDRTGLDFGGDPNIRTSDNVFQNFRDFDLNGDTSFLLGEGLGIATDIQTGPDGNLYVVSETKNAVYEIFSKANVAPFRQKNLVSDISNPPGGPATVTDTNLKNAWGISFSATGPFWVSNFGTNTSTVYSGDVGDPGSTFVKVPLTVTTPAPTGEVQNPTTDFVIPGTNRPAGFIFAAINGTINAWNSGPPLNNVAANVATVNGASYTGLAIGKNSAGANLLYAANHNTGKIDVFDKNFNLVTLGQGGNFEDPDLPPGTPFRAFNVQNLGGTLYVAYDKVVGSGATLDREHDGIVDAFDTDGHFLQRLVTGGVNAPWGLALAPANFGPFSGALLVGNFGFGDGKINAYDPTTGAFLGNLTDANGNAIAIEGLWGIIVGNGGSGGDRNALYFAAGIHRNMPNSFGAADGLFGALRFGLAPGGAAIPPGAAPLLQAARLGVGPIGSGITGALLSPVAVGGDALTAVPGTPMNGLPAAPGAGMVLSAAQQPPLDQTGVDWLSTSVTSDSSVAGDAVLSGVTGTSSSNAPGDLSFASAGPVLGDDLGLGGVP
jgi:uncharacterized protein (TIGR03118 family)